MDKDELLARAASGFGGEMSRITLEIMKDTGWNVPVARSLMVNASRGNPAVLAGALAEMTELLAKEIGDTLPISPDEGELGFHLVTKTDDEEGKQIDSWLRRGMTMLVAQIQGDKEDVTTHLCGILDTFEGWDLSKELLGTWTAQLELAEALIGAEHDWQKADGDLFEKLVDFRPGDLG